MSNTHLDRELRDFLTVEMKELLKTLDDRLKMQKIHQGNQTHPGIYNTNDETTFNERAKNTKKKRDLVIRMLSKLKKIYDKEKH